MICVSVAEPDLERCREVLSACQLAELRIDQTAFSATELQELFALPVDLVATCRPGARSEAQRASLLLTAIAAGAAYVDIEADADADLVRRVSQGARDHGCQLIISHHDPARTPQLSELEEILARCSRVGADIVKIVCRAQSAADCARLLSLYQREQRIIAFSLGSAWTFTRVAAHFLGAPFTYAAWAPGAATADGQLDLRRMERVLDALR